MLDAMGTNRLIGDNPTPITIKNTTIFKAYSAIPQGEEKQLAGLSPRAAHEPGRSSFRPQPVTRPNMVRLEQYYSPAGAKL
jgi:hypothetical protein